MLNAGAVGVGLLVVAQACLAGIPDQVREVASAEFASENLKSLPGELSFRLRYFAIPIGCEYVSHEVVVVDEFPKRAPEENRSISTNKLKVAPANVQGLSGVLSVQIAAKRPNDMPVGRAYLKVKVSVTADCEASVIGRFHRIFEARENTNEIRE